MRVLQVASTYGKRCGVGTFAGNLHAALRCSGVKVKTVRSVPDGARADVTILHHEWGLFPDDGEARETVQRCPGPVVLFAHSGGGIERFSDTVEGFCALSPELVGPTPRPVCAMPHPAWTPARLEDRAVLRARFGLPADRTVVGSSGFLMRQREFPEVLERLLPHARAHGWFVDLVSSRWSADVPELRQHLQSLARGYPDHLRFGTRFLDGPELNARLQACDLIWCWTKMPSRPYGSGSASDQYASGTRMFVADKAQHAHVLGRPNVVRGPAELDAFVDALAVEIGRGVFTRHDPSALAWEHCVPVLTEFLTRVVSAPAPARAATARP